MSRADNIHPGRAPLSSEKPRKSADRVFPSARRLYGAKPTTAVTVIKCTEHRRTENSTNVPSRLSRLPLNFMHNKISHAHHFANKPYKHTDSDTSGAVTPLRITSTHLNRGRQKPVRAHGPPHLPRHAVSHSVPCASAPAGTALRKEQPIRSIVVTFSIGGNRRGLTKERMILGISDTKKGKYLVVHGQS